LILHFVFEYFVAAVVVPQCSVMDVVGFDYAEEEAGFVAVPVPFEFEASAVVD
jgi:hypothetical protein